MANQAEDLQLQDTEKRLPLLLEVKEVAAEMRTSSAMMLDDKKVTDFSVV